jgi:asparaginyl-tRNA synthetase
VLHTFQLFQHNSCVVLALDVISIFFLHNFLCFIQDVVEKDFVQLTYTDAIELLLKSKKKFEFPVLHTNCDI